MALANEELTTGGSAAVIGNEGRARVCARRAVGAFLQRVAPALSLDYGTHAMANLRGVMHDASLPDEIRSAAERLLGGARSIGSGQLYSTAPLADAMLIIRHFLKETA